MLELAPHLDKFLNRQNIPHHIFGIQQTDHLRFNRASLLNIGFIYVHEKFDYVALHDVDLLPLNDDLSYDYPKTGVFHVSAPGLHPMYNYVSVIFVINVRKYLIAKLFLYY